MVPARSRLDAQAAALTVLLCAVWGLNQVAIKVAEQGISPMWLAGLRSIGASVLVLTWAVWRRQSLTRSDGSWWPGLLLGFLFTAEFVLFFLGLARTSVTQGVILIYTAPFFVAGGAHFLLPGDRLSGPKLVGLAGAFLGIVLTLTGGGEVGGGLLGNLFCLASGALWGGTTLLIKASRLSVMPAAKTLMYQLVISALALPLLAITLSERGVFRPTLLVIAALLFQIAVASASYGVWLWLIARYPASMLASFTFLAPVFGVIAGAVLLGEPIGWRLALALALIAGGIWLVNRRHPARPG